MKAPAFWARPAGWSARALTPLSAAYRVGAAVRRQLASPRTAGIPVICVGNLVAGGAGKTPTAIAVMLRLRAAGANVHFLTRGYGGRTAGPAVVDLAHHTADEVGDEPLLLAAHAPTWVARNRPDGAVAARSAGADCLVMDDGFQNPTLHKDVSLLVIDGENGLGNGHVLPAGPLREPPGRALTRSQAVVLIGEDRTGVVGRIMDGRLPILAARLEPIGDTTWVRSGPLVAFAGIARPAKFFRMLERLGATLTAEFAYPDHHAFKPEDLMHMTEIASAAGAQLTTTAKDYARLPDEMREIVRILPVRLVWADEAAVDRILIPAIASDDGQPRLNEPDHDVPPVKHGS